MVWYSRLGNDDALGKKKQTDKQHTIINYSGRNLRNDVWKWTLTGKKERKKYVGY